MKTLTISVQEAEKIKIPVWGSKQSRDMYRYIAGQSLYDKYEDGMMISYTVRDNGSLKDLFFSNDKGDILPKSNKLTFKNGFFKILN